MQTLNDTLWVDHQNYFGPDRRHASPRARLRERRKANCAGAPPQLRTAMAQLRFRALDARDRQLGVFIERTLSTALLAEMHDEPDTAHELSVLGARLARNPNDDMRAVIYDKLDRASRMLRQLH